MNYDALLPFLVLVLLAARFGYWKVTERQAKKEKPQAKQWTLRGMLIKVATNSFGIFLSFQLLGLQVFHFDMPLYVKVAGFLIVMIGIVFSFWGRRDIGANWSHAADYQIKKKQTLITSGIYSSVRHPIYTGIFLSFVGAEIVAESYLFLFVALVTALVLYNQAKREEALLQDHFGDAYTSYMKKTKMFLPYLW